MEDVPPDASPLDASGGANVSGNVDTNGGDFIGRDKQIQGDEVQRDKFVADVIHISYGVTPKPANGEPIAPAPGHPPYPGLHFFDIQDADYFFGRETVTGELLAHLRNHPLLIVVGASGSGKSSLVRAGLISALQRRLVPSDGGQFLKDSQRWPVHIITPTALPLESLAASLTRQSDSVRATANLIDDLTNDVRSLYLYAQRLLSQGSEGGRLVLVVDQFEELFTLCRDKTQQKNFVDNLLYAAGFDVTSNSTAPRQTEAPDQPIDLRRREFSNPVLVIITLRADFYAHCAEFENLRTVLERYQKYIGPMGVAELRRAIEEPARLNDWSFEEGLVDLILKDVGYEPGALPLLSHALLETWQRREGRTLTFEGYMSAGRIQGAIAKTADSVLQQYFTAEQRTIARNIFLRLTELGEGVQDTRRRASLTELIPQTEKRQAFEAVLKALADARLITTDQSSVEVAHEALIREWPQLREWLADDREGLRTHRRLTEAAQEWLVLGKDTGALLRGIRLEQVDAWDREHPELLNALEQEYLNASLATLKQERQREENLRQRELQQVQTLAEQQRQRAEEQARTAMNLRRRNTLLRVVSGLAILLMVVAIWFSVRSGENANEAVRQRVIAISNLELALQNQKAADRQAAIAENERRQAEDAQVKALYESLLSRRNKASTLAVKAQLALTQPDHIAQSEPLLLAREAVLTTWLTDTTVITQPFVTPDSDLALRLAIEQALPYRMTLPLHRHTDTVWSVAFSPDGKSLLTTSSDLSIRIWDVRTRQQRLLWSGHTDAIRSAVFSSDGKLIATTGEDATIRLWDAQNGQPLRVLAGHKGTVLTVAFSPDNKQLLTAGIDRTARLWNVATGQEVGQFLGHTAKLRSAAFSPDGAHIVTTSEDTTVKVWDVATRREIYSLHGHTKGTRSANFSPDGQSVVTAGDDAKLFLWNATTGKLIREFAKGPAQRIWVAIFSPTGQQVLTAGDGGTVFLWNVADGKPVHTFVGHAKNKNVVAATFSPDGKTAVTASSDFTVRFWDVTSGKQINQLEGHAAALRSVAVSPNGQTIVTAGDDKAIRVWDAQTGRELHVFPGYDVGYSYKINLVAFSPDGKMLASAGDEPTIRLWDTTTWHEIRLLASYTGAVKAIAIDRTSRRLVSASDDGTTRFWDIERGAELNHLEGYTATVKALAFSPDGQSVITVAADQSLRLWDVTSGHEIRRFAGATEDLRAVAFSPDGQIVATAGADGQARLWTVSTGKEARAFAHATAINCIAFSADDKLLAISGEDKAAHILDVQTGKELNILYGHTNKVTAITFSLKDPILITASADGTARIWDVRNNHVLKGHDKKVSWAVFSPDGKTIATASGDGTARLWNVNNGQFIATQRMNAEIVNGVEFSQDGKLIATVSDDHTLRLWRSANGEALRRFLAPAALNSVVFSPDDELVATAARDNNIYIWQLTTGETITLTGHTNEVKSVNFSPDGKVLVSTGYDQTIRLWDVQQHKEIRKFQGHTDWINYVAFNHAGDTLISASRDQSVRLWDVATGQQVLVFKQLDQVNTAAFSPDDKLIVTASDDGSAWLWDTITGRKIRQVHDHASIVKSAFFSPDGKQVVTASNDMTAQVWTVEIQDLLARAESLVQRDPPILVEK